MLCRPRGALAQELQNVLSDGFRNNWPIVGDAGDSDDGKVKPGVNVEKW